MQYLLPTAKEWFYLQPAHGALRSILFLLPPWRPALFGVPETNTFKKYGICTYCCGRYPHTLPSTLALI